MDADDIKDIYRTGLITTPIRNELHLNDLQFRKDFARHPWAQFLVWFIKTYETEPEFNAAVQRSFDPEQTLDLGCIQLRFVYKEEETTEMNGHGRPFVLLTVDRANDTRGRASGTEKTKQQWRFEIYAQAGDERVRALKSLKVQVHALIAEMATSRGCTESPASSEEDMEEPVPDAPASDDDEPTTHGTAHASSARSPVVQHRTPTFEPSARLLLPVQRATSPNKRRRSRPTVSSDDEP